MLTHTAFQCSICCGLKMASLVLYGLLIISRTVSGGEYRSEGFIDKLSNSMKFAKDFLGSESVALKVAEFVVRSFQTTNNQHTNKRKPPSSEAYEDEASPSEVFAQENRPDSAMYEPSHPMTPLRHLVRLFGLEPNQISAVAVNALVFVAQMISTFLAGPKRPTRPHRSEDPTTWILNKNSRKLQHIIATAKNESLPDAIEELIREQGSEDDTTCIRLLVCKITPFIIRMQKAVFGGENMTLYDSKEVRGAAVMYRHLPTVEEINDRNDICERQHKDCELNE